MDPGAVAKLLRGARTRAPLERAIDVEFSYLEPGFVESEDFAATEEQIWIRMHRLRVLLEDTYWAALKRHGVAFEHFDFSAAWLVAHKAYGLAVATADFRAIAEALRYLELLYIFRGADLALAIQPLAGGSRISVRRCSLTGLPTRKLASSPTRTPSRFRRRAPSR